MIFPSMNWVVAFESRSLAFGSTPAVASAPGGVFGRMKVLSLALLVGLLMVGASLANPLGSDTVGRLRASKPRWGAGGTTAALTVT